ncbi:MAG: DUF1501 domain-containing protein [Planctomycetales bacterium]|nr:DUF1501 domain-containing protein [Planctomycetales bacterium]
MNPSTRFSRRQLLQSSACGFGYLALAGMANSVRAGETQNPLAPRPTHHAPRAKRVIFVFMHGGPSQVDTFDYKPQLDKDDGKELPFEPAKNLSRGIQRKMMKSPWAFRQYGECGMWVSDLFPNVARHADDLCVVNSMHTDGQSHGQAVMRLHTGENTFVRPSVGAWVNYGLGTENENLPGFVTICPPRGHGGTRNYGSAFLPAVYQGTRIGDPGQALKDAQIGNIENPELTSDLQRRQLNLLQSMNRESADRNPANTQLEGVIESYELAFRMQSSVPRLMDLAGESAETLKQYGVGNGVTDDFGRQCLMARRLAENGVRFIELTHDNWDHHGGVAKNMPLRCSQVDQPIAALLQDLSQRGLLDDTLVLWGGEFGRTPDDPRGDGRGHNKDGFTMWLAGGGVRGGMNWGATDEYGYEAVEGRVHVHDLHATILHLMGLDHTRLTFRYGGRDFRLTDVFGNVVRPIIA